MQIRYLCSGQRSIGIIYDTGLEGFHSIDEVGISKACPLQNRQPLSKRGLCVTCLAIGEAHGFDQPVSADVAIAS